MSRHRNRRGRPHRLQSLGTYRDPFSPSAQDYLNRNPNSAKHGSPRLDHEDAELARIRDAELADSSVSVTEYRVKDRRGRKIGRPSKTPSWRYQAQRSDFDGKRYERPAA